MENKNTVFGKYNKNSTEKKSFTNKQYNFIDQNKLLNFSIDELRGMKWFIFTTVPRKEIFFVQHILNSISAENKEKICIFVPSNKKCSNINNIDEFQPHEIMHLLGFVFIGITYEDNIKNVFDTYPMNAISKNMYKLAKLLTGEAIEWQKIIKMFHIEKNNNVDLEQGNMIRIIKGPFKGISAHIVEVNKQNKFPIKATIKIMGINKIVEIKNNEIMVFK